MISNLYEGRVMIVNSGLKVVKDTYALSEGKTIDLGGGHPLPAGGEHVPL